MLKNKLVIIPLATSWNWTADYLRQTALVLAKNNQVIIYDQAQAYFFARSKLKKHYPQLKNISFVQPKYFLPGRRFKVLERINRQLSFKLLLCKHWHKSKILWFFDPGQQYFAKSKAGQTMSLFDCVDYHSATVDPLEAKRILINEKKMIDQVDYFFVNSQSLKKIYQPLAGKKKIFRLKAQGFCPARTALQQNKRHNDQSLTLGYVGGINHRLDFHLIDDLAINNPSWQIVLIGPKQSHPRADKKFQTKQWLRKFAKIGNIQLKPAQNRQKLFESIQNFDWGIIPYNVALDYNRFSYPMKVFEYLYCGKKVLSTPIDELKNKQFQHKVFIGKTARDWQKIILNHSAGPEIELGDWQKMALNNSWENKIEEISTVIENKL